MIKADQFTCHIASNTKAEVFADLGVIIKSIKENKLLSKEECLRCVEIGFMTDEEIEKEADRIEKEIKSEIKNGLKKFLDDLDELSEAFKKQQEDPDGDWLEKFKKSHFREE